MALLDELGGLLGNITGGSLSEEETHAHYDQVAKTVPRQQLGAAIGPALSGLDTQDVQSRVANSASQMSPQQKGSLVESLLGALGGASGGGGGTLGGVLGALGGAGGGAAGGLGGLLGQLGIDPSVAQNPQSASPEDVGKLAAHAKENDPGIFQQAMSFYSQHPTLVKALGTVAIAQIARHLANPQA